MAIGIKRFIVVSLIVLPVVALAALVDVWVKDHHAVLRFIYPLEAALVKTQIRCSAHAPLWLRDIPPLAMNVFGALAGQVAYRSPDGQIYHCEHGWAGGLFRSPAVSAESRFRYASLTKLLTADSVLRRVQSGGYKLGGYRLSDRLVEFVPEWRSTVDARVADITIEQLLRHRAGFDRMRSLDPMTIHKTKPWCPGDLSRAGDLRLDFEPGSRSAYANLGYCMLGVWLERVEGAPYRALMERDHGLLARGMRFIDGPYLADEVRYDFRNSAFYVENYHRYFDFQALSSSAGLSGSAVAMAKLLGDLIHRQPLNISSMDDVQCNSHEILSCRSLGAMVSRWSGSPWVIHSHGGTLYGASAQALMDNDGGVLVMLGNGMPTDWNQASHEFLSSVHELYQLHRKPPKSS